MNLKKSNAFTIAEVLITLGIIGIIAAMTLPGLIKNYQHKILEAQFKKSVSIISQAVLKSKENLSTDSLTTFCTSYDSNNDKYTNTEICYKVFYETLMYLNGKNRSVFEIILDRRNETIKTYNGKQRVTVSAIAGAGTAIFRARALPDGSFVSPHINERKFYIGADINGNKGPNQLGHDIFIFTLNKKNDTLEYHTKPQNLSDEEVESGDYQFEYEKERKGNPCNIHSSQKANGIGCAYYALRDECPDGSGSGYFRCLP